MELLLSCCLCCSAVFTIDLFVVVVYCCCGFICCSCTCSCPLWPHLMLAVNEPNNMSNKSTQTQKITHTHTQSCVLVGWGGSKRWSERLPKKNR